MNDIAKTQLQEWHGRHRDRFKTVADLGAYNINGAVKEVIPEAIGFDISPGPGVDVVIAPGIIPELWRHRFDLVTSIGSFQCCNVPDLYKSEILDLLAVKPNGVLFLAMCGARCRTLHSTSPNVYGYHDNVRMTRDGLIAFFAPEFKCIECREFPEQPNDDLMYIGRRR
ncbi:MAG: class I SAM-dependent methyltransferase [Verrucomicrobia bacterium]|nr:class I SAM-dependent methyltransferase [Verrucomicrobiota bacterium]